MRRSPSRNPHGERDDPVQVPVTDPRRLFEEQLPLIERVIASTSRRKALQSADAEEFASWARLKLLEDDCAILAKFGGRSSLKTYLVTVVHNLFRDYRITRWGRWRPSAAAKRLGVTAVRLERLMHRDGLGFDQAAEMLRRNFGEQRSIEELAELAADLPVRTSRRVEGVEGEEELARLGEAGKLQSDGTEARVRGLERRRDARRLEAMLESALAELEPVEREVLRLHFEEELTVATVARSLQLDQKPLYRTIARCLRHLRGRLEECGVSAETVDGLVGWDALDLVVHYEKRGGGEPGNRSGGPV